MRLSKFEVDSIVSLANQHFGSNVEVYLFGSRTNDKQHGGDIDLYICKPNEEQLGMRSKINFLTDLVIKIGEQKIDVVLDHPAIQNSGFYKTINQTKDTIMLIGKLNEKLAETLVICDLHHERMMFAFKNIEKYFPLTESILSQISPIELALFDQLIYRFSKLQDIMGSRLFKQLLESLEEDTDGLPFIDILNKMEKLNLITSAKDWITLRQTRNTVSHEYPFYKEVQIQELNLLPEEVQKLSSIWVDLKKYAIGRQL